jgi:glycyl-tRNA synthetase beta chain
MAPARELLLEIGTEEIPAGFLAKALVDLKALAEERLKGARLEHGAVLTLGTPRRIALSVKDLADRQPDISEVVTGPPAKVAFDSAGKPTKAALGFAAKVGVPIEEVSVVDLPGKGAYAAARRADMGAETKTLLPRLLAELVRAPEPIPVRTTRKAVENR